MSVYRATMQGVLFLQTVMNVVHFRKTDSVDATDMPLLATDLRDNWLQTVKVNNFSEFVWQSIKIEKPGTSVAAVNLTIAINGTSGSGSNAMPFSCVVMKLTSALAGRHGRGRIYFPCLGPACMQNGIITPSCITAFNTMATNLMARYGPTGTSTFDICISERAAPQSSVAVTGMAPRATPGVQRRRNVGVGI